MFKQSFGVVLAVVIVAASTDAIPGVAGDLVVHEWGTFTTIAGADGRAVAWRPIDGPADLPCFVEHADMPPKASFVTTVRMETPVIYFYAPRPLTVDLSVGFREGLMTEFFPRPTSINQRPGLPAPTAMSRLVWNGIQVIPGAVANLPSETAPNHYFAARAADAAPLQVGPQREKFLFYRGVGGFELPLRAIVNAEHGIDLVNDGPDPIPALMLFENRGGRIRFHSTRLSGRQITIPSLTLDSDINSVRAALLSILTGEGLYKKEAEAMVETWRDSWYEEGTRIFYIVPKRLVDRTLPLTIRPVPAAVARVFVGRLELATPQRLGDLRAAFAALDRETLAAHGRFLEPFSRRILDRGLPADERVRILATLASTTNSSPTRSAQPCPRRG